MVFESKVDLWLQVLYVLSIAVIGATTFPMLAKPMGQAELFTLGITAAVGVAFPLWLYLSTTYTVTQEECLVRSGPFRWVVPLDSIESVTPTHSPLSAPALSLDRLRITYSGGKILLVSPQDKKGFIEALGID